MKTKRIYKLVAFLLLTGLFTENLLAQEHSNAVGNTVSHLNYVRERVILDPASDQTMVTHRYYDGVGRMIETVARGITPSHKDLVTYLEYNENDQLGKEWLAYPVEGTQGFHSHGDGRAVCDFYGDSRPYHETSYEHSPLQRPVAVYAAGDAWKMHPSRINYQLNRDTEELRCRCYRMDGQTLTYKGWYLPGQLQVEKAKDEDGKLAYTFKNASGFTVLERKLDGNVYLDTYYVYDYIDNLRYVLPPLAWSDLSSENLTKYAYRFDYDKWKHCVKKQLPGGKVLEYAYDYADRLIFSQDAVQKKSKEASFYFYDIFGREAVRGICQMAVVPSLSDFVPAVKRAASGGDLQSGYLFPMTLELTRLVSVSYYDDYDFLNLDLMKDAKTTLIYSAESGYDSPYVSDILPEFSAKGRLTGRCIFNADIPSSCRKSSAFYYDNKHRMVQSLTYDTRGYGDKSYYHYSFTGNLLKMLHRHIATGQAPLEELYTYSYDHADRLTNVKYRLNDTPEHNLTNRQYDELCRLNRIAIGDGKQVTNYTYNLHGCLTSIDSQGFSQKLHYQDVSGGNISTYNGNISRMTWYTYGDSLSRGYNFSYDGLNRLMRADYTGNGNYSTSYGYDRMGNLLNIQRYGQISATEHGLIDNLSLKYNGNQLKTVHDNAPHLAYGGVDFKDGANQSVEYTYDANGNLTQDLNKKITNIQYNYLNLPSRIVFENGNAISYVYGADGTKLRTTHVIGNDTTVTDYCGNVIYENSIPVKLLTEGGYVTLNDHKYHYFIQDHQGNNRLVVDQNGVVEEKNDYYPFGGLMSSSSSSVQPYKYNGKELDTKNGLNWYDYGARMYDAVLGRWHVMDPMAEKYYGWSPYVYCKNNPVLRVDIDGKDDYTINSAGRLFRTTVKGSTSDRLMSTRSGVELITVKDKELLSGMYSKQDSKLGGLEIYNSTSSLEDATAVFKFGADNTSVEWKLDVYNDNGSKVAIIGTSGKEGSVFSDKQSELNVKGDKVVDMHSHPYNAQASDHDMKILKIKTGAVYHRDSKVLFFYNSGNSRIGNNEYKIDTSKTLLDKLKDKFMK